MMSIVSRSRSNSPNGLRSEAFAHLGCHGIPFLARGLFFRRQVNHDEEELSVFGVVPDNHDGQVGEWNVCRINSRDLLTLSGDCDCGDEESGENHAREVSRLRNVKVD